MRLFVTFKANTTASNKVMVFNDLTQRQVQDTMIKYYGGTWDNIYTEPELSKLLPQIYNFTEQWIGFGTKIIGQTTCGKEEIYPKIYVPKYTVSVEPITDWFKKAKPTFVSKDIATQLGAHIEEVTEMLSVFKNKTDNTDLQNQFIKAYLEMHKLSKMLYKTEKLPDLNQEEKIDLLDSLADQVVTLTGSAYFFNFKFNEALSEVNRSNFSKFENDKPIFNENKKIIKGKNYTKPDLGNFV